ncbi:hypothetical protein ABW20_dc0106381 [Dactylellina cionopaga]|nr:hypothetical protein ABW20_dc0106381 [Dactylellina cionopaga]
MADREGAAEEVRRDVYHRIASFFQQHKHEIVQIELLPFYPVPDTHIYTESTSLGIPKSSLWKAFQHARPLFFTTLSSISSPKSPQPSMQTYQILLTTTTILLLHDCEHLTAINTRKRILLSLFPAGAPFPLGPLDRGQEFAISPQAEFVFLTSLLTSPLHRHTKSPHLWAHRRWLLNTYPTLKYAPPPSSSSSSGSSSSRPSTSSSSASKLLRKWSRSEITTVLRAAESHPKNYYAWTYARWLVTSNHVSFNHEELVSWCVKHTSDVSGWGFLAWLWITERDNMVLAAQQQQQQQLLDNSSSGRRSSTGGDSSGGRSRQDVLQERYNQLLIILKYSHNTSPGHESLWEFVKAVIRRGVFDSDGGDIGGGGGWGRNIDYRAQILTMIRTWDAKEWPGRTAAEDIFKERMLIRGLLREIDAAAAAAAYSYHSARSQDEDRVMEDL